MRIQKVWCKVIAAVCTVAMITGGLNLTTVSVKAADSKTASEKEITQTITDPLEDGLYTLTFQSQKEDSDEESMLAGYFDPKAKLTVKNGKMQLSMLNTKLADFLIDFSVAAGDEFVASEKKGMGEPNKAGTYDSYEYTMSITKPSEITKGAVLVSAMGGQISDIGDYSKYIKADFTFTSITSGWNGYDADQPEEVVDGKKALNDALMDFGLDRDGDGVVTAEEVATYTGDKMDLTQYKLTDIDLLRYLPETVTELNLSDNNIETIPEGLLDGLTGLENFYIENNRVKDIPTGLFRNNANMDWISFAGNELTSVEKGDFTGLDRLTILDLESNKITQVGEDAFAGMPKVEQLSLAGNALTTLPDHCFTSVAGAVKQLYLQENRFTTLPKAVGECYALTELNAYDNAITDISEVDFSKMTSLQEINFMHNYIREIPEKAFVSNTSLAGIDLYDNQLKEMSPDCLPQGITLRKLDVRLNDIRVVDKKLINKSQSFNKFYPQKSVMELTVKQDGTKGICWSEQFDILNLIFWYEETNDAKVSEIASVDEYREFLKENGCTEQDIVDVLNEYSYDWDIVTKVQKKNAEGQFVTVSESTNADKADETTGSFATNDKGVYRVAKELYTTTSGYKLYRFTVYSNEYTLGDSAAPTVQPTNTPNPPKEDKKPIIKKVAKPGKVTGLKKKKVTKHTAVLTWKAMKNVSGYEVYVSSKKKGGYRKIKTLKKAGSKRITIRKLRKGKTYRCKVRAYRQVSGKKVYGAFSKSINIKIK